MSGATGDAAAGGDPVDVVVVAYNILRGGRRGRPLDDAVRALAADVLLVSEAPKTPLLWRCRSARLARAWGLRIAGGGRPAGDNLILVGPRVDVVDTTSVEMPVDVGQPRRGYVTARLRVGGRALSVLATHLALPDPVRAEETVEVLAAADALPGPVVVGGDLNEGPRGPSWRRLVAAGYADHGDPAWLTFPSDAPDRRIDALLVRGGAPGDPGVQVRQVGSPGVDADLLARASDHRPVLARIRLTDR